MSCDDDLLRCVDDVLRIDALRFFATTPTGMRTFHNALTAALKNLSECADRCKGKQGPCAGCGERRPLPFRRDEMGGYVCNTCVDKSLSARSEQLDKLHAAFVELYDAAVPVEKYVQPACAQFMTMDLVMWVTDLREAMRAAPKSLQSAAIWWRERPR